MVCQSLDKTGDLKGQLIYIKSLKGKEVSVILSDGTEAVSSIDGLNINPKSVRMYDPNKDPVFV